ncbi:glycoside hydrolase family 113 [Pseudonocardia sp. CA-107938]|uniref:glycoside hydrolase family 113 n=1 Tax=Pseudonocardia sp. CA-107938 TaxID=3240021 RepID=UPI003D8A3753
MNGSSLARWATGVGAALAVALGSWTAPAIAAPAAGPVPTSAGPSVADPWRPGRPELGVQVYWVNNPADSDEVVLAKARRLFAQVIGMEANAVGVTFPFFTESLTASAVHVDGRTPTPERVGLVLAQARAMGLRTSLRPLLDEANLQQQDPHSWRGKLLPRHRDAWYASYEELVTPYLHVAERVGVDTVVLGAELNSLQDDPHWPALVGRARDVYRGELAYTANWDAYATARTGVPVDVIGIDAYPQLDVTAGDGEDRLTAAWTTWLDSARIGRGAVLTEVGAAAEAQTLENPAVPHRAGAPLDEGIQRRWFTAACRAAHDRGLGGLYWWKIGFDVDPAAVDPAADLHDSWLGRAAQPAMRACFAAWGRST